MKTLLFIRIFFLFICAVVGYYVGILLHEPLLGLQIGSLSGLVLILIEKKLEHVSVRGLSSVVFGLLLGVFMAKLISNILDLLPLGDFILSVSEIVLTVMFSYFGAVMALRGKDEFNIIIPYVRFKRQDIYEGVILLDTNIIIDGRIIDIFKTHFLQGRMVVPRFVLQELQTLADSADEIKRQRGRRGLEMLKIMERDPDVDVRIHEDNLTGLEAVDAKLVKLAKQMDACICTLDFNLGRMAALQGVEVLNINELIHAVKSVVLPGDSLEVMLVKEGKENDQALAYLEDGTMIVVSNARHMIGHKVKISIASVLQTQAGKMVFAKLQGNE